MTARMAVLSEPDLHFTQRQWIEMNKAHAALSRLNIATIRSSPSQPDDLRRGWMPKRRLRRRDPITVRSSCLGSKEQT